MIWRLRIAICVALLLAVSAAAQPLSQSASVRRKKLDPRRQFVLDVVRSAVALPIADQQDRLRVLTAAAQVAAPVSRLLEEKYAREGARVEADLIARGERPAVSMLGSGYIDCATAAEFVQAVPAAQVPLAEQSLVGIVSACPRQDLQAVRLKLESALDQGVLAARALLATMERIGAKSAWAQAEFVKVFSSLSPDLADVRPEVPYYAALFVRMAPNVEKDAARRAGLKLLEWLAQLDDSGERRLAVNLVTNAMRQVLGQKAYDDALSGNVVARDIAATSGQPVLLKQPFAGGVSVLAAMADPKDRIASLSALPPSLCAREAAAHGFASGTAGHPEQASRYFDLAFSARRRRLVIPQSARDAGLSQCHARRRCRRCCSGGQRSRRAGRSRGGPAAYPGTIGSLGRSPRHACGGQSCSQPTRVFGTAPKHCAALILAVCSPGATGSPGYAAFRRSRTSLIWSWPAIMLCNCPRIMARRLSGSPRCNAFSSSPARRLRPLPAPAGWTGRRRRPFAVPPSYHAESWRPKPLGGVRRGPVD